MKAITCHLNERGYRTRAGARFGVATIHGILTNRVYVGDWVFNRRCSRTLTEKPKAEQIPITVPAIISLSEFEAVQATLKAHSPRTTPARVVTGPILLTGLATCATCNGPMTLRTGTSKSGRVHRYYSCSTHGRQGKTGCIGRSIRMDTLDTLVTDRLVAELLQPARLQATLAALWSRRAEEAMEVDGRVAALRREVEAAEDKMKRLYRMVEDGMTDLDEILRDRLARLKEERDGAKAALHRIQVTERPPAEIAPELIERFGRLMRENVTTGEIPFRKAWLQSIVDRVEVGADLIRIIGGKENLQAAVLSAEASAAPGVRSSVRKSRTSDNARLPPQQYQPFSVSAKHSKPDFAPTKSRLLRLCAIKHPTPVGWAYTARRSVHEDAQLPASRRTSMSTPPNSKIEPLLAPDRISAGGRSNHMGVNH